MMAFENSLNISKICRTCLSEETSVNLFSCTVKVSNGETTRLYEMLMSCASVQVMEDDGLPNHVCFQCTDSIIRSFTFKQLCEKTDSTLRQFTHTCLELKPNPLNLMELETHDEKACEELEPKIESIDIEITKIDTSNSDIGTNANIEVESVENKKVNRNQEIKDDTEQCIHPGEECTQDLITVKDPKVLLRPHSKKKTKQTCKLCNQEFASISTLSRHMKVHGGEKRHLCSECGKRFLRPEYLTRHLRTHTGEKPFSCKLCNKSFTGSSILLEHMRAHADEKSFVCSTCGKAFSRRAGLVAHRKTHSGIKSHECRLCGKRLAGAGSLAMHMKMHTGLRDHICPYCGKGFTTPSNLIIHKRIHTGDRNHVCTVCKKGFYQPSTLKAHMRIHTGEKPYSCKICKKAFAQTGALAAHMKTH